MSDTDFIQEFPAKITQESQSLNFNYLKREYLNLYNVSLPNYNNNHNHQECKQIFQEIFVKLQTMTNQIKIQEQKISKLSDDNSQLLKQKNDFMNKFDEKEKELKNQKLKFQQDKEKQNKLIRDLEGKKKDLEKSQRKNDKEMKQLKETHLKKQLSKTNNFELSKISNKKQYFSSQIDKNYDREEHFKSTQQLLISRLSERFQNMFSFCQELYNFLFTYLSQRKTYLLDKIRNNEAIYEDGALQEYDQIESTINQMNLEDIEDRTQLKEIQQKFDLYFKFIDQFEGFLNKDFKSFTENEFVYVKGPFFQQQQNIESKKFLEIKNVKELQFLLKNYNDLSEKQKQLSSNQNELLDMQSQVLEKNQPKNLDLIERLKSNINNLDIFIDEQQKNFISQQQRLKDNEESLRKAQGKMDNLIFKQFNQNNNGKKN